MFRLRRNDICLKCKVSLEIENVKDNEELKRFEIVAHCPKCGATSEFIRSKRLRIEEED